MATDQTTDRSTDAPADTGDVRDSFGEGVSAARSLLRDRFSAMANDAADVYSSALKAKGKLPRNIGAQLAAARDVVQLLLDSKLTPEISGKPSSRKPASQQSQQRTPQEMAEAGEKLRLVKQAERRAR